MKRIIILFFLLPSLLHGTRSTAHPGSGIVIDKYGQVYFTDTGKGVWKIDAKGILTYLPSSRFHWLTIDPSGSFGASPKSFGQYFERVSEQNSKPALITCSDFPIAVNRDGYLYYAATRPNSAKIIRRTADGKESVLASNKIFEFVNGIVAAKDGSIYITEASNPNANTVKKISMDGKISTIATFVGKSGKDLPLETVPSYCRGLAVDSTGIIYVAATGSRSILKSTPQGNIEAIRQESSPWTPTGVAVFKGEVYVLEWHDVDASRLEEREAWIPRVIKIGRDGKVTILASVSR